MLCAALKNCVSINSFCILGMLICLFVWFYSLRTINNLSVIKGRVFLGWTSTKLGLMFLLKDITQWRRWGSNPRSFGLESSSLPLSHCAPLYADLFSKLTFSQKKKNKKTKQKKNRNTWRHQSAISVGSRSGPAESRSGPIEADLGPNFLQRQKCISIRIFCWCWFIVDCYSNCGIL